MNNTYKLAFWIKPLVFAFVLVMLCGLPIGTIQTIQKPGTAEISLIVLGVILLAFLIYLIKTLFDISKDAYKAVTVDFDSQQLILTHKKQGLEYLHFDNIQVLRLIKGEILRGISLGHIDIIDKQGNIYSLTISNISSFYVNLSSYLPMNMDERMFFATK